jgi:hypothetical protein
MTRRSISILLAACAVFGAGCGSSTPSAQGPKTTLTITENFGATQLFVPEGVPATSGLTALRQLESAHDVTTAYGGRYVKTISGVAEDSDRSWLFFVDGIESKVGATSVRLKPGQAVQWDIHAWQTVRTGGAIVGAYPRPLKQHGVRVICAPQKSPGCKAAKLGLHNSGIAVSKRSPTKLIVGTWNNIEGFDGVPNLTAPGDQNGAFAQFSKGGETLTPSNADGSDAHPLTDQAGLLAAFSTGPDVVWIVSGTDEEGVKKAADLLDEGGPELKNRFAFAVGEPGLLALPEGAEQ